MMTSAQVHETSVNVITNSHSQDYTHPDDHNLPTYKTFLGLSIILKKFVKKKKDLLWRRGELLNFCYLSEIRISKHLKLGCRQYQIERKYGAMIK